MMTSLRRFLRAQDGATAVEYGLIAALIGMVIISGAGAVGAAINKQFTMLGATIADGHS